MGGNAKTAGADLEALKRPIDELRKEFQALTRDQKEATLVAALRQQEQVVGETDQAFNDFLKTTRQVLGSGIGARVAGEFVTARDEGKGLTGVLEDLGNRLHIPEEKMRTLKESAGAFANLQVASGQAAAKVAVYRQGIEDLKKPTDSKAEADKIAAKAVEKYTEDLDKQLTKLKDKTAVEQAGTWLTEQKISAESELGKKVLEHAKAIDKQKAADKAATDATNAASSASKKAATEGQARVKALTDLEAASKREVNAAEGMAAAYAAGVDKSREFTLQQKVEEALMKTGAGARKAVEKAINAQADAQDRLSVSRAAYDLQQETADLIAQAKAQLGGAAALEAYNLQKSMTVALTGKNIEYGSKEYEQLLGVNKAKAEAVKIANQAERAGDIIDRLYPEAAALREYTEEQAALNKAMELYPEKADLYRDALIKLDNEYEVNKSKGTIWGQMTTAAIDRVDSAFADAWANIGEGAGSLWDNLKKGFKQTLGEIMHMLTTKPLLASISNWLTGTDNGQGLGSVWGKLLGGVGAAGSGSGTSSGGGLWSGAVGLGKNLYSAWSAVTGVGAAASSGFASGGITGAISGIGSYYSSMFSSAFSTLSSGVSSLASALGINTAATAASTAATAGAASGVGFGLGQPMMAGSFMSTTYAASTTSALSGALSSMGAMWPLAIVMGMYQSGKLYDAGVRPDSEAMWDSAGSTTLGKVAMTPQTLGAKWLEIQDNIMSKVVGGKLAAILSGSTLFQAVWSKVGTKLFGSGYQTKDAGISLGVNGGDFDPQQYVYQKKKGGLISGSSKKRTLYGALDAETETALGQAYNTTVLGAMDLFSTLNVALNEHVLDGLNVAATQISTMGKSQEDIQKEIDAWFTGLADSAVAAITDATGADLRGLNFANLQTFISNLFSVNNIIKHLNIGLFDVSVAGGHMTEQLQAMAGGLEALQALVSTYYDAFFTDSEKAANLVGDVRGQFSALGLVLPDSRDGFRDMVEGIDKSTDAGRGMFITLMNLAAAADSAYDVLESQLSTFYGAFYSESENTARAVAAVRAEFADANVALPATRAGFRAMVEGIDKTTESGRRLYEQMLALAGGADTLYDAQEAAATAKAEALNTAVNDAMSAVQRAVNAEKNALTTAYNARVSSLNDMASTAQESVSGLTSITNALDSALKALNGTSDDAVRMMRAQAKATVDSALAIARAGGSLSGFEGLTDALSVISDNDTAMYASLEDFNREQGRNANLVAELNGITGKQLTADQQLLKTVQDQIKAAKTQYDDEMARLDGQLELAQAQIDALNGVNTSVLSVRDAMSGLSSAIAAASAAKAATTPAVVNSGAGGAPSASDLNSIYQQVLGRDVDAAGAVYWAGQLGSNAVNAQTIADAIRADAIANGEIQAHAAGGYITGPGTGTSDSILSWLSNGEYVMSARAVQMFGTGLLDQMNAGRMPGFAVGGGVNIGETGPVLQITRPAQIYASQPQAQQQAGPSASDAATLAELRSILNEMRVLSGHAKKTSDNTGQIAEVGVQTIGTTQVKVIA